MCTALVIEDTPKVRQSIVDILSLEGYEVIQAEDGESGVRLAEELSPDIIICDIVMPGMDGYEVLERLRHSPVTLTIPFIFLTGKSDKDDFRKGMILGADDYITKPFASEDLVEAVSAQIARWKMVSEKLFKRSSERMVETHEQTSTDEPEDATLAREAQPEEVFLGIVGASPAMQDIFATLRDVGDVDVPVLILGETGTGKELVAHALHESGSRRKKPFVAVNCAALPAELVESELFGHDKGAFTGAYQQHVGKAEMADGGTLFLDEIGEMPIALQGKLLRFLEEHTFERVGSSSPIEVDVRVVSATNRDVESSVNDGHLRMDLLYRLNTITVALPPLRERAQDIPLLATNFVEDANKRFGCDVTSVDASVYAPLMTYQWPGNVRELKNVVDRAVVLTKSGMITQERIGLATSNLPAPDLVSVAASGGTGTAQSLTELKTKMIDQFERTYIDSLLREVHGNVSEAARAARIDRRNFIAKMQRFDLRREDYRQR